MLGAHECQVPQGSGLWGTPQEARCNDGSGHCSLAYPGFFIVVRQPHVAESRGASPGVTAVGFEPTQLALVELEPSPLDHSGKLS